MTNIDTNKHSALRVESLRKLEVVQISSCLRVYLTKDVRRFRQVKLGAITSSYDLRWHAILEHDLFESLVIIFTLQDANYHRWVTELLLSHHVLTQFIIKLLAVVFLRKLDPMWLFYSEL